MGGFVGCGGLGAGERVGSGIGDRVLGEKLAGKG